MKQSNFLKTLSLFLMAIATAVAFASCSSDNDELENPDNSGGISTDSMIPYTALPGTWIIESIKDSETGKVTAINQTITIGKFEPSQEFTDLDVIIDDIEVSNGHEFWTYGYSDILSYANNVDEDHKGVMFGFCKQQNKGFGSTMVYEMILSTDTYINEEDNRIQIFNLSNLHLSGNVLTAYESMYSSLPTPMIPQILGTITMKKL